MEYDDVMQRIEYLYDEMAEDLDNWDMRSVLHKIVAMEAAICKYYRKRFRSKGGSWAPMSKNFPDQYAKMSLDPVRINVYELIAQEGLDEKLHNRRADGHD